jgi:negative regulator of replication initiation
VKSIEVSDAVYAALQQLATKARATPDEVLLSLLSVPAASPESTEPLAAFVVGAEFRGALTDDDKYLGLLGWIATRHAEEFGEFIRRQSGCRRYLSMSHEELLETCQHNQARQIDGTQYWAVLNLNSATRRRFLARLLEFIGYRDAVIDFVCGVIGLRGALGRRSNTFLVA